MEGREREEKYAWEGKEGEERGSVSMSFSFKGTVKSMSGRGRMGKEGVTQHLSH